MNRLFIELYPDQDVDVLVAEWFRAGGFVATTTRDAGNLQAPGRLRSRTRVRMRVPSLCAGLGGAGGFCWLSRVKWSIKLCLSGTRDVVRHDDAGRQSGDTRGRDARGARRQIR